jgi:hypothetical protein
LELKTPGAATIVRTLELAPGATVELTLSVQGSPPAPAAAPPPAGEPASAPPPTADSVAITHEPTSLRPYAYAATAVGVVGLGAFGVFGLSSKKTHDELLAACPGGQCQSDEADRIDRGKQQQLLANIGLGVGLAGLGAAVTLFLLEPSETETAFVISPFGIGLRRSL